MSQTYEFYSQRAQASAAEAEAAVLDNVRERALRSAKAWSEMADRAQLIEQERIKSDEMRAARRELEIAQLAAKASPLEG